jgi:hypothetical protein
LQKEPMLSEQNGDSNPGESKSVSLGARLKATYRSGVVQLMWKKGRSVYWNYFVLDFLKGKATRRRLKMPADEAQRLLERVQ